ncbi:cysteine-rich receptor-like protein kinase 10 [Camellia sinensis]|uniref:cysteine-rich receptor-like protein kinase 10 n=1 Tax=Camellia sinensis TaxID=4442 RepID=UPI0010368DBD|nr:cysteine-rich receptor-like protein kinase 10 [Camellia sinensis]
MVYWRLLFFFSLTLITITITITTAQPNFTFSYCVPNTNYSTTTTYVANLKTLFSYLFSAIDSYGFYNAFLGQNSDRVNAIVHCRGDVELGICHSCVNDSTHKLIQVCPNFMETIAWYDYCMLRLN